MITELFKIALVTSLAGSALTLIIALAHPFTKRRFSAGWNYYVWLAVIFVMLCPMRISLPERAKTTVTPPSHAAVQTAQTADTGDNTGNTAAADTQAAPMRTARTNAVNALRTTAADKLDLLAYIWIIAAAALFAAKIISHAAFRHRLKISSRITGLPGLSQYTSRRVTVRKSGSIISPLIVGVFRPVLLLPETELTDEQLHYVLLHEAAHLNRNDILYKWLAAIVKCVHWFNPAAYFMAARVNTECEISCDLSVTNDMTRGEEIAYAQTILALLSSGKRGVPLTTGMTGGKRILRRRFEMIRNKRDIGKRTRIVSAALAVVMTASAALAGGVLADGVLGGDNGANVIKYEIYDGGRLIETAHEPLIYNHDYYLPLRETLNGFGCTDISYENGAATVRVPEDEGITPIPSGMKDVPPDYPTQFILDVNQQYPGMKFGEDSGVALRNKPILVNGTMYAPEDVFETLAGCYESFADFRLNVIKPTDPESYYENGEEAVIGTAEEQDKYTNENPGKKVKRIITDNNGRVILVVPAQNQEWETRQSLHRMGWNGASGYTDIFDDAHYFQNFRGENCVYPAEWDISGKYRHITASPMSGDAPDDEFLAIVSVTDWVTLPTNDVNAGMKQIVTNTYDSDYGAQPFTGEGAVTTSEYDNTTPEYTIDQFFKYFENGDFDNMKRYCTENCVNGFFGDGYCFGMTEARLEAAETEPSDYVKSLNGFAMSVRVSMTPHEGSVYREGQTETAFYVILRRQPDGGYLIDEFATGL